MKYGPRPHGDERRAQVLAFIRKHIAQHGTSPTLEAIADAVGVYSKQTAHYHIEKLVEQGKLRSAGLRGYVLVERGLRIEGFVS